MYEIKHEEIYGADLSADKVAEKISELSKGGWKPFGIIKRSGNEFWTDDEWVEYEVWFERKKKDPPPPGCEHL